MLIIFKINNLENASDYKYSFCGTTDVNLQYFDILSNEDFIVYYYAKFVNLPQSNETQGLNIDKVFARIDHRSGATIWAKSYLYKNSLFELFCYQMNIFNDKIWIVSAAYQTNFYRAVITKFDQNGNIIDSFGMLDSISLGQLPYYFTPLNITILTNENFVISADTSYLNSGLGIAPNSFFDKTLIKVNIEHKIEWISTFDLHLYFEGLSCLHSFNYSIYLSVVSDINYYCLIKVDELNGHVQNSRCFYNNTGSQVDARKFCVFCVSSKHVLIYDQLGIGSIANKNLLILDYSTFDILKVFKIPNTSAIYGYIMLKNDYDINSDLEYLLISKEYGYVRKTIVSQSLTLDISVFAFNSEGYKNSFRNKFDSKVINDHVYISNCDSYLTPFNTTSELNFIHKLDLNFQSLYEFDSSIEVDSNIVDWYFGYDITLTYESTSVNETPTALYHESWTFDPSKPENKMESYLIVDLTDCIWPKFPPTMTSRNSILPKYMLSKGYQIKIGTNVKDPLAFSPYHQCQNSKFYIKIIEKYSLQTPSWIQINEMDETFQIMRDNVTSVGETTLLFQSQLIAYSLPQDNFLSYSTNQSETVFIFLNDNCVIIKEPNISYLVKDVMKTFRLDFIDNENDKISIKIAQNDAFSAFSQSIKDTLSYSILIQSFESTNNLTKIEIFYTDFYHQETSFWEKIEINVWLFASEPPVFVTLPGNILIDRCNSKTVNLPEISDPDETLPTDLSKLISVDSIFPSLIYINNQGEIVFNLTDKSLDYSILSSVVLTLTDSTGAFTKYIVELSNTPYFAPDFNKLQDIIQISAESKTVQIQFYSKYTIVAINCYSKQEIKWIKFEPDSSELLINSPQELSSTDDCFILRSTDSCNEVVYSKPIKIIFNVNIQKREYPPSITGSFGPLILGKDETKLFEIPDDLFHDVNGLSLHYSVDGCIDKANTNINISISKPRFGFKNYILISSKEALVCFFPIIATNVYLESTEFLVQLLVVNCASKDCSACTGPYESNCTRCNEGYTLQSNGYCEREIVHFIVSHMSFYETLGLIEQYN